MEPTNFEWTPEFWSGWRESSNPYRKYKSERDRRLVLQLLDPRDGERVLEVGCGYGWISRALWGAANIQWVGVDRSEAMICRLRAAQPGRSTQTLLGDACGLPFGEGRFDKVLCTGVLMHVTDYATAVRELIRVLRPGGHLLCSVNNILSPCSIPVRVWNLRKKEFVQKFLLPRKFRRLLHEGGVQLDRMAGDGIIATVPFTFGRLGFPPASMHGPVCKLDQWATRRFPLLAYELWFHGVKAISSCVF
jgi:SAM-dependent methyltransferase